MAQSNLHHSIAFILASLYVIVFSASCGNASQVYVSADGMKGRIAYDTLSNARGDTSFLLGIDAVTGEIVKYGGRIYLDEGKSEENRTHNRIEDLKANLSIGLIFSPLLFFIAIMLSGGGSEATKMPPFIPDLKWPTLKPFRVFFLFLSASGVSALSGFACDVALRLLGYLNLSSWMDFITDIGSEIVYSLMIVVVGKLFISIYKHFAIYPLWLYIVFMMFFNLMSLTPRIFFGDVIQRSLDKRVSDLFIPMKSSVVRGSVLEGDSLSYFAYSASDLFLLDSRDGAYHVKGYVHSTNMPHWWNDKQYVSLPDDTAAEIEREVKEYLYLNHEDVIHRKNRIELFDVMVFIIVQLGLIMYTLPEIWWKKRLHKVFGLSFAISVYKLHSTDRNKYVAWVLNNQLFSSDRKFISEVMTQMDGVVSMVASDPMETNLMRINALTNLQPPTRRKSPLRRMFDVFEKIREYT